MSEKRKAEDEPNEQEPKKQQLGDADEEEKPETKADADAAHKPVCCFDPRSPLEIDPCDCFAAC
jgi:hypothetical protein